MNNRQLIHLAERWDAPVHCSDPLPALDSLILWEQFRPVLETALSKERRSAPKYRYFDPVQLYKAAVLKALYGLTDAQLGFLAADRLSFQRFIGLPAGKVDDQALGSSLWSFLEFLRWQGLIYPLCDRFHDLLDEAGVRVEQGKITDVRVVGLAGARG